ncbi:MAG TPA: hypothetical protein VE309_11350 [Caulobacteraceae bacterium]|nr:hypothetical protein [Caulobacteraceae bacterium]
MNLPQSTLGFASAGVAFADPDWRGEPDEERAADRRLRPQASLAEQERRLGDWIRGGACYGWLNAYQARRAAFELQSIRAQRAQDPMGASCRRAVQSRLDRLDGMLNQVRAAGQR